MSLSTCTPADSRFEMEEVGETAECSDDPHNQMDISELQLERNVSGDGERDGRESGEAESKYTRLRQYGDSTQGPFVVYLRATQKHTLISVKVSSALFNKYASITNIDPVNRDKLRIIFSDKSEANALPKDSEFAKKYYVYIPAIKCEVDGKIFLNECDDVVDILSGYGMMENSVEEMKILEVYRLKRKIVVNDKVSTTYTPYVRVTFEGIVLPDYLIVNKLRIPVLPFVPRIMHCALCLRTGHTHIHCGNSLRCRRCGNVHKSGEEKEECSSEAFRCPNCKIIYREFSHRCPRVEQIQNEKVNEVIRIREDKRKNIQNYTGVSLNKKMKNNEGPRKINRARRSLVNEAEFPALKTANKFGSLTEEDSELEEGEILQDTIEEEMVVSNENHRSGKRKLSPEAGSNTDNEWFDWAREVDREKAKKNAKFENPKAGPSNVTDLNDKSSRIDPSKKSRNARSLSNEGYEGWKTIILNFLLKLGIDKNMIQLINEVVLPSLERVVAILIPRFFDFLFKNNQQ